VLFASTLPWSCRHASVQSSDGTLDAEASVVALHNMADALLSPPVLPAKLQLDRETMTVNPKQ